jgi:hypothetical protein
VRHIRTISVAPRAAQIEQINLIIGLIQGVIGIFSSFTRLAEDLADAFGFDLPQKDPQA